MNVIKLKVSSSYFLSLSLLLFLFLILYSTTCACNHPSMSKRPRRRRVKMTFISNTLVFPLFFHHPIQIYSEFRIFHSLQFHKKLSAAKAFHFFLSLYSQKLILRPTNTQATHKQIFIQLFIQFIHLF